MRPIAEVAADLDFTPADLVPAGRGVLRIPVSLVRSRAIGASKGRLILVTGMTPTEHGEGKTVTSIALAMALRRRGHRSVVCLRQPSLGPVFGAKGGASGGGRSTVEPRRDIDLGFTGDLDAITNAQNLLVTWVEDHLFHGNRLGVDSAQAVLPRASPLEDRSLRDIQSGLSVRAPGFPRPGQFVITPACEMAAIHGLASSYADLNARIERMVVARTADGTPIRASEIESTASVATLLARAMMPNLVQTVEGTPALVHGVPYANVAHGTCSRLAIEAGLASSEYCVVEAGFSTELGAEKFVDIVGPQTGLHADAAVIVVTVRALRWHGTAASGDTSGESGALERGLPNLEKHVENLRKMGLAPVVALNRFPDDSAEEIERVRLFCDEQHLLWAPVTAFADGGEGAEALADRVVESAAQGQFSHSLYGSRASAEEILRTVVVNVYGGRDYELTEEAQIDLARIRREGPTDGPICIAKTPLSLSADSKLRGRPRGFTVSVRRLTRWSGAGFTVAIAGSIMVMPGLPVRPSAGAIYLTDDGTVLGLG
ncbi:MAG: formate--tetrahydrofolate ligase [Thermoplasmata archaeon]|nr:formate--tetrahydrofolate ligase [Thermoplasmata archaeon]